MDEFEQAERSDYELDRADEHELQRLDWLELHGMTVEHPSFDEAVIAMGQDRADASREWP